MDDETELYQRLAQIGNELALARRTAQDEPRVPPALHDCLDRLCECSLHLRQTCLVVGGDEAVADGLGQLEVMTAQARSMCDGEGITRLLATGLGLAHDDVRDLRRQLHR